MIRKRGFEIAKGYEKEDVILPKRATKYSAGYDICTIENITIKPNQIVVAKTGIKAYMQNNEVLKIYPRSSLSLKKQITMPNNVGIIDKDYYGNKYNDGHIMVLLYNFGEKEITIEKNERIAQGIFEEYLSVDDDQKDFIKRSGGFGSTGKF